MKRQHFFVLLCVLILGVTCIMLIFFRPQEKEVVSINRAIAAKMLALTRKAPEELNTEDTTQGWYMAYIATAKESCGMDDMNGDFRPMDLLTYGEAAMVAQKFGVNTEELSFKTGASYTDKPIDATDWFALYDVIISKTGNVEKKELLILGTTSNIAELGSWQCITGDGALGFRGISLDSYIDANINAYVRGNEIAGVSGISQNPGIVKNLWVISGNAQQLQVYIHGYHRTFELKQPLQTSVEKVMADVSFENQSVSKLSLKTSVIKGEILSYGADFVEIKNYGKVPVSQPFHVYQMYGGIEEVSMEALETGNKHTEFVVEGENICAAIIRAKTDEQTIRVVLSSDGYSGYNHSFVQLTSDVPFSCVLNDVRSDYEAGSIVDINTSNLGDGQSMTFSSSATAGKIQVNSLNRNQGHPKYRGSITVTNKDSSLIIVNELLLEEYVYGVIPSEMPASYESEALKVQAVCARSFAVKAMADGRFDDYGADVDDSTSTQVYNNNPEDERANAAADATADSILTWQETPISTYFYSTSSGSSASPDEVWLSGENPEYMKGRLQIVGESERDFLSEDVFKAFIDDYAGKDYFEKEISWFRWKTSLSRADLRTSIDKSLLTRIRVVPSLITVRDGSGNFMEREISTIGDVTNVYVNERCTSGLLKSVIVEGTAETIKITGEYNIRLLLAPVNSEVICDDGTNAGTMTMMPSGFFYISDNGDGSFTIRGGGFGHGAGMSQNGVQELAKRGLGFEEILKHYFGEAVLTVY